MSTKCLAGVPGWGTAAEGKWKLVRKRKKSAHMTGRRKAREDNRETEIEKLIVSGGPKGVDTGAAVGGRWPLVGSKAR